AGRGPRAGIRARGVRRAAVDPDDHRAALGDPRGDRRMTSAIEGATGTMVGLISSYADNKGALGRRYGEWAVSGPTVEAAVAAAAMAQDELGHARSTYPVLDKLGHPREEDGLDTPDALPMLRDELPDWASMIAANL